MQRATDICVVVKLRVLDGRANPGACGQVRDCVEFLASKQFGHSLVVTKIENIDETGTFVPSPNRFSVEEPPPMLPRTLGEYIECERCGGTYKPEVLHCMRPPAV